jgi:hypothetical protein
MQIRQPLAEMVGTWPVDEEDSTRVRARCAVDALPGEPSRQVDGHSATAKFRDHAEESHTEIPHENVNVLRRSGQVVPEFAQLIFPRVPGKVPMQVNQLDLVSPPDVPDLVIRLQLAYEGSRIRLVLLVLAVA